MTSKIQNENKIHQRALLLQILAGKSEGQKKSTSKTPIVGKRDTFTISQEAEEIIQTQNVGKTGKSSFERIDASIDLNFYLEQAKSANKEAIANAGDEIKFDNKDGYMSAGHACRAALTEKYSRLVKEAKSSSNPEEYIQRRYNDPTCSWYVSGLSKEEKRIAYNYEMQMLKDGKIRGVKYNDTLLKGVNLYAEPTQASQSEHLRQLVNAQMNNIWEKNGITITDGQKFSFKVDPYSNYISVICDDDSLGKEMEKALNVGDNGKNLYKHIMRSSDFNGMTSSQMDKEGAKKKNLYGEIYNSLGLDIRTLTEKDGTYYTDAGEDIIDVYHEYIDASKMRPDQKASAKSWFANTVHEISKKGWDNIEDLVLEIAYGTDGLVDKYQDFGFGATNREWLVQVLAKSNYSVI